MNDQMHHTKPTRRDVIATAGAAGLAIGVDALMGASQAQSAKVPHVVIVGAGLAGLCAAYLLQQKGWTYTILEAEPQHVGGRVRTMPIGNGLYWEAGAMRIPKNHDITRKYIALFSELKLRDFVMFNPKSLLFARGARATSENESEIRKLFTLTWDEAEMSADDLWNLSVKNIAKGTAPGGLSRREREELSTANTFTSPKLIDFDRLSLRQLIRAARLGNKQPLSDEAVEYLLFVYGNLTIQHGASTEFLREELHDVWVPGFSEIIGGNGLFPKAFLDRLNSKPKMGCEVIGLYQDKLRGRVRAEYRIGDAIGHEEGDFLLCTVPFPVLAQLKVEPHFSYYKRRAIVEMGYDSGTKVALLTKNRFWEKNDGIYGGSSTTDLMTGAIIYPSDNATDMDPTVSDRPGVFLACYTWGQDARRLGAMPASERKDFVIQQVSQVHPELRENGMILDRKSWSWDTYRWCRGAFAFYQPGQFARMHEHVIKNEDRIYFAGEHCSHSHSWMQGALESAENAVGKLVARAG
jgi:monoamine oxidase